MLTHAGHQGDIATLDTIFYILTFPFDLNTPNDETGSLDLTCLSTHGVMRNTVDRVIGRLE